MLICWSARSDEQGRKQETLWAEALYVKRLTWQNLPSGSTRSRTTEKEPFEIRGSPSTSTGSLVRVDHLCRLTTVFNSWRPAERIVLDLHGKVHLSLDFMMCWTFKYGARSWIVKNLVGRKCKFALPNRRGGEEWRSGISLLESCGMCYKKKEKYQMPWDIKWCQILHL